MAFRKQDMVSSMVSAKGVSSRLIRQSGTYTLGNLALKASGLLLAVLYLNPAYLTVEGL